MSLCLPLVACLALLPLASSLDPEMQSGSRLMQSSNTVPRMGRRASEADSPLSKLDSSLSEEDNTLSQMYSPLSEMANPFSTFIPQYPFPRLLKKRFRFKKKVNNLPAWLRADFARAGKRGPPTFGIPDHWRVSPNKREAETLTGLRHRLYPDLRKRSAQQSTDQWVPFWSTQLHRTPQGFRLHDGDLDHISRTVMYKRSEDPVGDLMYKRAEDPVRDLNSVPLMGKRGEERLVRVPREEEEEVKEKQIQHEEYQEDEDQEGITNPWTLLFDDDLPTSLYNFM